MLEEFDVHRLHCYCPEYMSRCHCLSMTDQARFAIFSFDSQRSPQPLYDSWGLQSLRAGKQRLCEQNFGVQFVFVTKGFMRSDRPIPSRGCRAWPNAPDCRRRRHLFVVSNSSHPLRNEPDKLMSWKEKGRLLAIPCWDRHYLTHKSIPLAVLDINALSNFNLKMSEHAFQSLRW